MFEQGAHSVFDKLFGRPAFPISRRICWLGSDTVKIPGQLAFLIRLSGRPGCLTNLKGLVSQRNNCFGARPMGNHVAQNMFEQDAHSVPTNRLVAQLSRSADTFAGTFRIL
jgi:hypothetical protein